MCHTANKNVFGEFYHYTILRTWLSIQGPTSTWPWTWNDVALSADSIFPTNGPTKPNQYLAQQAHLRNGLWERISQNGPKATAAQFPQVGSPQNSVFHKNAPHSLLAVIRSENVNQEPMVSLNRTKTDHGFVNRSSKNEAVTFSIGHLF